MTTMPTGTTSALPVHAPMQPERYRVPAQGTVTVQLCAGDRLTVVDPEGGQPAALIAINGKGRGTPGLLTSADSNGNGHATVHMRRIADVVAMPPCAQQRLASHGHGLANGQDKACVVEAGEAGHSASFLAQQDVLCMLAAPGANMQIDQINNQNPPTDLVAFIARNRPTDSQAPSPLPAPLAEPRLDLRIAANTAEAYTVQAGEFIQIIDVAGRECSDFQALDLRQLEKGTECALDVTTTRSLSGHAYPAPGLHSKYYNAQMEPVIEVIRDTVGRHDTFGLACNAKYYEDQGYFGHPNCSDNFSTALAPWHVAARRGWMAVNFFYNTWIDDAHVLYLDQPWSRPGDYVLLRALSDVVCVSSACPDDTSAANGWQPTDVHVRVYAAGNNFSKGKVFRMKPDDDAKLTRESGFHARTSKLTRNFTEYVGFWLPTCFSGHGAVDEYHACRQKAAVMDLSALRKFEVLGPDAEALMQSVATRNVRKLATGQVVYTAMCYEHGGMLDDGTIFRLGEHSFRWVGGQEYGGEWLRNAAAERGFQQVRIKSSTSQAHNIAVQGPRSRDILSQIIWTPPQRPAISELPWFRFTVGRIGGEQGIAVLVSRTGYTGELGFEVFCHPDNAPAVWDAVMEAGQPHGLTPLGLEALDMLRIEAGLIFAGYEFCDQTDPFEAGIGFTVALKSNDEDFIGRTALEKRKANPQRQLVGLVLEGNEPAAHGDPVCNGRAQVGVITSAMRSPLLCKNIALSRVDVAHAGVGTRLEVGKLDGHQKRLAASVVALPFYDPGKERVRA